MREHIHAFKAKNDIAAANFFNFCFLVESGYFKIWMILEVHLLCLKKSIPRISKGCDRLKRQAFRRSGYI